MVTYKIKDSKELITKIYNCLEPIQNEEYRIEFFSRKREGIPFIEMIALLKEGDALLEEKIIYYTDEKEAKDYISNYFNKQFLKYKILSQNIQFKNNDFKIVGTNNFSYNDFLKIGSSKKEAAFSAIQSFLNKGASEDTLLFEEYKPIKITNHSVLLLCDKYKKFNLEFLFFDRSEMFNIPVVECVCLNKNWFGNTFKFLDLRKDLLKRVFICEKDLKTAMIAGIEELLYGNECTFFNISNFNYSPKNEISLPKNYFDKYSENYKNISCYISDVISYNKKQYYCCFVDTEIREDSYEDYLKSLLKENIYNVENDACNLYCFKNKLRQHLNIDTLREYLNLISCLTLDDEVVKEKALGINFGNFPVLYSEYYENEPYLLLLYFIVSHKAAGKDFEEIWNLADQAFGDKRMFEVTKNILSGNMDIFDNPYIFNV